MTNKNILTYGSKVSAIEQVYFSPVVVVPPLIDVPLGTTYCFLSKVEPWPNDVDPPAPTQDQISIKKVFKNIFAAKLIHSNDISPVIERRDWLTGTVYDYYRDDVDMFEQDINGKQVLNYYVKNRFDQVFKCLWNVNGSPSTIEPYFEPGSYGTNNIFKGVDGYKWKYIYTIDTGSKVKFMDTSWIPVPVGQSTPNPLISTAGCGNIDVINVLDGGSNYDPSNAVVSIVITGDGQGASATPIVVDGVITEVIVTNAGNNYTQATATVTSTLGTGATLISPTSPVGGHGFDPVSEFGCNHVMFSTEFSGSEDGILPTDIDFHQVGLVVNPTTKELSPNPANGAIYKTTTDFVVAPGFGSYINDEQIYQGTSIENAAFIGTVLSFDQASNVIRVLNTTGTPITNAPVFGNSSKTVRTLLSYSNPNFVLFSGYISFIENRTGIQRSADGIEQIKIVLGY